MYSLDLREFAVENIRTNIIFTVLAQTKSQPPGPTISRHPFLPKLMIAHEGTCFSLTTKITSKDNKIDFYLMPDFLSSLSY